MQPKTPLFTSGSQHPPRFGHAVYLGDDSTIWLMPIWKNLFVAVKWQNNVEKCELQAIFPIKIVIFLL